MMNRLVRSTALAGALAMLAGGAMAQEFQLSLSTSQPVTDPLVIAMQGAEKKIEERTDGRVDVTIFPSSQLGEDNDVLEQIRNGAPIAVLVDAGRLAPFMKELGILSAPYLVNDYTQYAAITDSPVYNEWVETLADDAGLRLLNYNWFQGTRQMFTKKLIEKPADLNGVRVRTIDAPSWIATVSAMGATPAPMAWSEVYSALQLGAIDGAEAQLTGAAGIKLHEVSTNVALTNHIQLFTGLATSEQWWSSLPEDIRTIIDEELKAAGDEATRMTADKLAEVQAMMEEAGVAFNEVDLAPFREATAKVYEEVGLVEARKALEPYLPK
ncbi:Putative TRAP dicarboxylate transporter, DctP subunit [Pseudorhizobium banfieldiae]|uniref:Putative TRAP dicarboxylate transporter, DctP subunit n=1 Tax=Pseudorhizobium banfieldiae TaxID=1125847 RepID=L0NI48_9HYPH|nr:C4-dicarboxylate TRAP transporter substrate-binding protein [Pseudorhizobium banfieldiae]CAD6617480.1 C4-dicarboxylate ABC transporter [arsenite-oxidising bacterium NT-25]CCF20778.1 Putative TRAP dicarboxylate transporter, DctP subunit [Pseudorhizobium banfieldiae]